MELVVVNGSNAISRGVLSKLAGKNYQKIRLLDFRPYRKSVYAWQRALPSGVQVEKHQVQTIANLDLALEGARDVVYFTHDYFAQTSDKNNFIQATAKLAKKHGVDKLVAVCPIEHELYWSEDKHTPIEVRDNAQVQALQNFDKLTILNSNLVFGRDSYLLHYMTQCAYAGKIPKSIGGSKSFQYRPVSSEDLTSAVETALARTNDVKGQRFQVSGAQAASLNDILHLVEKQVGRDSGSTRLRRSLGLSDFVEEYFTGITHDKNMGRMADYMEAHTPNFEATSPDFFKQFGLTQKVSLQDYFGTNKVKEEDLVFPIFTDYKMVSLN
jgi:hypothetical protein